MEIHWYMVPGDRELPWGTQSTTPASHGYFKQLAGALDHLGYTGVLLATSGYDCWLNGTALIPHTQRLKFIIAVHPGIVAPLRMAEYSATFDQISNGRLIINIITGDGKQLEPYGVTLDHDSRYQLTDEYWEVWRRLMNGDTVDYEGKHLKVRGAKLQIPFVQKPYPSLFFGGSSGPALAVAAKHADTYLTWGEPPPQAAEKIAAVRSLAAAQGRAVRFGIRLMVIVREKKEEAWAQAQRFLDRMDPNVMRAMATWRENATESVGQRRLHQVIGNKLPKHARELEFYPDMWSGYGLVRGGPGTAIVGDPETVAARIQEYRDIGFDTFILSNFPLVEEAYRVAELLFPVLKFPVEQKTGTVFSFAAPPRQQVVEAIAD
jgi:alkanesulfonate monooxygenase